MEFVHNGDIKQQERFSLLIFSTHGNADVFQPLFVVFTNILNCIKCCATVVIKYLTLALIYNQDFINFSTR